MRLGSFDLVEPIPELNAPHAIAALRPWVDVGNVGTLTLARLEELLDARELARLTRPGNFFDFTRYRPSMSQKSGVRDITIPNIMVTYARRKADNDFIFLHLLEPHMLGELYVNSVLLLLKKLHVVRYSLMGSMYDMVPHTRPLLVTGSAVGTQATADLSQAGVGHSDYEGPTSICYLISQQAAEMGMETASIIVHLPQYTELEEDYTGQVRMANVFSSLYDIPVDESDVQRAEKQFRDIEVAVSRNAKIKAIVRELEAHYDAVSAKTENQTTPQLSPEIEGFLKEIENRFKQD